MLFTAKNNFRLAYLILLGIGISAAMLFIATKRAMGPPLTSLETSVFLTPKVTDRNFIPLTVTYENKWNLYDTIPIQNMPDLIIKAFTASEDNRFFQHNGIDWLARLNAVIINLRRLSAVRGASTISEQVIRMFNERPRSIWSKWLEGWEAVQLEKKFPKEKILEFYLNQVPFGERRRGISQASKYYFDRTPETLDINEILALAVLVRAPNRFNPQRNADSLSPRINQLAERMVLLNLLSEDSALRVKKSSLYVLKNATQPIEASHFVRYVRKNANYIEAHTIYEANYSEKIITTLDGKLQENVQNIINRRLQDLSSKNVHNGAALVVDHTTNEVLAWVNAKTSSHKNKNSEWFDAVTLPRQPGSTLKPLLYAQALGHGLTAASIIDDAPISKSVGRGLHNYHNYSRVFYGPVTLRNALGNSLNTPSIRTVQLIGIASFYSLLKDIGFENLKHNSDFYGEGLVLGTGEVSLFELVQAYAVLARGGEFIPLNILKGRNRNHSSTLSHRIFSHEISSVISNILSDPEARKLEFGDGLRMPVQTAIKTGTSSDFHDSWAIGFNYNCVVGVWLGNIDATPTDGVTGAVGPAIALRSIFKELNRNKKTSPLTLCGSLEIHAVCRDTGKIPGNGCAIINEYFIPGTAPLETCGNSYQIKDNKIYVISPTPNLHMAVNPRIPEENEAFRFELSDIPDNTFVKWYVDGKQTAATETASYLWPMKKGRHNVFAEVIGLTNETLVTDTVYFTVK